MNKLFIPYELALKLKELGFDEDYLGVWMKDGSLVIKGEQLDDDIKAPLWQQAFDFLVKKCNLDASEYSLEYAENGWLLCKFNEIAQDFDVLLLNEEALKKLIELCKKN